MSSLLKCSIFSLKLITGEKLTKNISEEVLIDGVVAVLYSSNFRLLFQLQNEYLLSVPLYSIMYIVYKTTNLRASSSISIQLRGLYSLTLSSRTPDKLYKSILKLVKLCKNSSRGILSIQDSIENIKNFPPSEKHSIEKPTHYFESLCNSILDIRWKLSEVNRNFHLIPTYPRIICVPETITDKMITNCASLVVDGRIPVICWSNIESKAAIYRGGILLCDNAVTEQMDYWKGIQLAAKPYAALPILVEEAKTTTSAISSIALYMASETEISTLLQSIANYTLSPNRFDPDSFREISRWERRQRSAINSVKAVANMILNENKTVVLQSNNRGGPLFTVSALTQLIVDAKFRTLKGFCSLIEKEFVYFGFPFFSKIETSSKKQCSLSEYNGGFILFIDSVWTFLSQIGFAFEFNKELLLFLVDILSSGLYDTFAYSCEKDRKTDIQRPIWNYILRDPIPFINTIYKPTPSTTVLQLCEGKFCCLWNSWFIQRKIVLPKLDNDPISDAIDCYKNKNPELNLCKRKIIYIHRDWLFYFKELSSIDLSENCLTDFPLELFELKNLRKLILDNNFINKLPIQAPINRKLKLRLLSMNNNRISRFPNDFPIPLSLRCLSLQNNTITQFELSQKIDRLIELKLTNNNILHFSINAPNLRYLCLGKNQLDYIPETISKLSSLTSLNLSHNILSQPFSSSLSLLINLVDLDLSYVSLDKHCDSLKDSLFSIISLIDLSLEHCFTNPDVIKHLGNLINLKKLNLNSNSLSLIPSCILSLVKLEILTLKNNDITKLPQNITNLKSLYHLDIRDNKLTHFTDKILDIGTLKESEEFLFEGNPLNDKYKFNGIFPSPQNIFNHLQSGNLIIEDLIPVLSLYFVGPSKSGKSLLISSLFPLVNISSYDKNNISDINNGVILYDTISCDINETLFHLRIREYSSHEESETIFYEWFLKYTNPIYIITWRVSQPVDSECLKYWMEKAKSCKNSCVIVICLHNEPCTTAGAKKKFFSQFPIIDYPIITFLLLNIKELEDSISIFTEALSQAVQNSENIIEQPFILAAETEQLLKNYHKQRAPTVCPYVSYQQYCDLAMNESICEEAQIHASLIYLHQTGNGLQIEDYIILDLCWFNNVLCSVLSSKQLWDEKGMTESSQLMNYFITTFPDSQLDLRGMIALIIATKVLYFYESKVFYPSALPFDNEQSDKGAFWKGKLDSCLHHNRYKLFYIPRQMLHILSISCFSKTLEYIDYSCFIELYFGTWSIKEPDGNFIFFYTNKKTGDMDLCSTKDTKLYKELIKISDKILNEYKLYFKPKKDIPLRTSNWLSWK